MKDFFISYNKADHDWAEWIAWQLEDAGYTTIIQAWDFRPSSNFVSEINRALNEAERTIAVLSSEYLEAVYPESEWAASFARNPTGEKGFLLPVRVKECELRGLLSQIVYVDLVGLDESAAKHALLEGVKRSRAKPTRPPAFPSPTRSEPRQYPGTTAQKLSSEQRPFGHYWGLIAGICLLGFLLVAFLIQRAGHTPSQNTGQELSKEKDQNVPRLDGEIDQVIIVDSTDIKGTQVFINLSIRNTGGTSIADNFLLSVKSPDLEYKHSPAEFPKEYTLPLGGKKSNVLLHQQDSMEGKTSKPIERGNLVNGWLKFIIEGIKPEIVRRPKTKFTISFTDVLGQTHLATYEMPQHSANP
jgi:TIR domain